MRKIYILPNFITTANMFCGFYSMVAAIHHEYIVASWAIVAAAVFDSLDGRVARLAKATSQFGVEYDSLSDLISFGVAPGLLLYLWALEPFGQLGWVASFLYVVCGALRLARFNVTTHALPKNFFQGLPIPGAAGMVASYVIFRGAFNWDGPAGSYNDVFILIYAIFLAALMISSIPFFSFKEFHWRSKGSFGVLLLVLLSMILIAIRPEIMLFTLLATYVCMSLVWAVFRKLKPAKMTASSEGSR